MLIVVDSSALLSILLGEPDAEQIAGLLHTASQKIASSVTIYETRTVLLRRADRRYLDPFESLLSIAELRQHAFDERQADIASQAYARFGRGSCSPAKLNLADCASYALAISLDAPLLYKGNDFAQTDVRCALTD